MDTIIATSIFLILVLQILPAQVLSGENLRDILLSEREFQDIMRRDSKFLDLVQRDYSLEDTLVQDARFRDVVVHDQAFRAVIVLDSQFRGTLLQDDELRDKVLQEDSFRVRLIQDEQFRATVLGDHQLRTSSSTASNNKTAKNLPRLSSTCPEGTYVDQGYIKLYTVATCTCDIVLPFDTSARVQWFNYNSDQVGETGNSSTLTIPSGPHNQNRTYICKAFAKGRVYGSGVAFAPKFSVVLPPSVRLSSSCPEGKWVSDGKIKIGTHATCACQISFLDSAPGHVQWFSSTGEELGSAGTVATLTIPSGRNDQNKTYTCKAISQQEVGIPEAVFTPAFFDPPEARLSSSCPDGKLVQDGYIRTGTYATCTCEMSFESSSSWVQWYNAKGQKLGQAGNRSTLIIPNRPKDKSQTYTCNGTSETTQFKSYVIFTPKFTDPFVNFQVNDTSSLVIQEGSNVTFSCEVDSVFPAIAVLVGPGHGQIQEFRSQNKTLKFPLSNVTCEDTGRYECRGDDGGELKTLDSQQFVDVNVKCALRMKDENKEFQFYFEQNQIIVIHIHVDIYGYPPPSNYTLTWQHGSSWSKISKETYEANYTQDPFGLLTIELARRNGTKGGELTIYNVNIHNGVGKGVDIKFSVKILKANDDLGSVWPGIAAGCATAIFIAIIIFLIFLCCRKRKTHCFHQKCATSSLQEIELKDMTLRPLPEVPDQESTMEDQSSHYEEINDMLHDDIYLEPDDPPCSPNPSTNPLITRYYSLSSPEGR